jgi:hypothetical protein
MQLVRRSGGENPTGTRHYCKRRSKMLSRVLTSVKFSMRFYPSHNKSLTGIKERRISSGKPKLGGHL